MNGNRNSQRSTRKAPPQNAPSVLLNDQENRCLFNLLGKKCVTMATGVAQVFLANGANGTWIKSCTGVCCFVKDNLKRSYFIRVYSLKKSVLQWEQEMYNEFEYMAPRPYFLTFATNECRAALNFANENEAEKFRKILDEKIRAKKDGKQRITLPHHNSGSNIAKSAPPIPSHNKPPPPAAVQPPTRQHISSHLTVVDAKPQESNKKKDKKKKKNKSKISKADISSPSGFQHVTHVGWDPEKNSFDMNKVDDSVKELFSSAGITEKDMEDEETAKFIYDFIEKQGGIDAVKKDQDRRRPPPAPPGHGGAVPPPPPPRKDGAPPPPRRNDNMRGGPPPPPPQRRPAGPPPPKSSSSGGGKPPPPPPSRSAPSLQQPPPPPPVASAIPAPPPMPPGGCIPPPPPPVMSVATPAPSRGAQTPLPPVSNARGNLLDQIRLGSPGLKSAAERNIPAPEPTPAGGRGALLDAIKLGKSLKPLSARIDKESPGSSESDGGGGGIADALKNALKKRENKIHSDSDSSEGDVDSDEWSD